MNKSELVVEIAKDLESRKEAQSAVDSLLSGITEALKKGDSVTLAGFGTFKTIHQKGRNGRNPRTGEAVRIKARNVPKFVPGKRLKETVD